MELAKRLHAKEPTIYKNPLHKPELACAITEFEAICGFLHIKDIIKHIFSTPELETLLSINEEANNLLKDTKKLYLEDELSEQANLKILFSSLISSEKKTTQIKAIELKNRLEKMSSLQGANKLAFRLCNEYPGDIGIFCAFFMCYRKLSPGEHIFIGPNQPHAYLSGDCAEIMVSSDNCIRCALTPKLCDTELFTSSVSYLQPHHQNAQFHPSYKHSSESVCQYSQIYKAPKYIRAEFQLERLVIKEFGRIMKVKKANFVAFMIFISGSATVYDEEMKNDDSNKVSLKKGNVILIPAETSFFFESYFS